MQAAGKLVDLLVKLAAGMEHCQRDLAGGFVFSRVHAHRNAAPVVADGNRVVHVDGDLDVLAVSRQGLVNGIVNYFVDKLMESIHIRVADIHARALPDWLQALEHLDLGRRRSLSGQPRPIVLRSPCYSFV